MSESNELLSWLNDCWSGVRGKEYRAIRTALTDYARLREEVGEWKQRADDLSYSSLERYPWIEAASKFIDDIRDWEGKK